MYIFLGENIIIIAGDYHIERYKKFFKNIGCDIIYEESKMRKYLRTADPSTRCVKSKPIFGLGYNDNELTDYNYK
jgi:hypothetical protein